eukprot:m.343379 g.343379  ORF g.343379 m.343379 type:complete len:219 (-) comp22770_c0_seq1:122-778(-)
MSIDQLPNEVLCIIFNFIDDGCTLSRCYGVCKRWRQVLLMDGVEDRWKKMCLKYDFEPYTQAFDRLFKKYKKERETAAKKGIIPFTVKCAYQDHYIKMRDRYCRHCQKIASKNLYFALIGYHLCNECRVTCYPLSVVSKTVAVKYFKKDGITDESLLRSGKPYETVKNMSNTGHLFRLQDVEELAGGLENPSVKANSDRLRKDKHMVTVDPEIDFVKL